MKTFQGIIDLLSASQSRLYAPIYFSHNATATATWIPIDKQQFIAELSQIGNLNAAFYCLITTELDGEMFLHPSQASN